MNVFMLMTIVSIDKQKNKELDKQFNKKTNHQSSNNNWKSKESKIQSSAHLRKVSK